MRQPDIRLDAARTVFAQLLRRKRRPGAKIGPYTVIEALGRGRYSSCYLAMDGIGRKVALKELMPGPFKRNKDKNAYEPVILSQLSDSRVPELLGVVVEKGFYGFALEHKPGRTLHDVLFKDRAAISHEAACRIGAKLIGVVAMLHRHGVVHRDIRTPNILLDGEDVYLVDFGLSRWADSRFYPFSLDYSYLGDALLYLLYSSFDARAPRSAIPARRATEHPNRSAGLPNRSKVLPKPDRAASMLPPRRNAPGPRRPLIARETPWYLELPLSDNQRLFLKKLFGLEPPYADIGEIERDYRGAFMAGADLHHEA